MKSFWNARRRYLLLLAFRRARQCSELASFGQKAGETFGLFASHKQRPCLAAGGGPDRSESTRAGDSRVDGSDAGTLAAITGRSVGRHGAARQSPAHALPGPMWTISPG